MKKLVFTNYQIMVYERFNYRLIELADFENIPITYNTKFTSEDVVYDIDIEKIYNNFIWIYAKYGNPKPCPRDLYDNVKQKYLQNNRKKNQVEMKNQLFALYSKEKQILYCSSSKKRSLLKNLLKNILQKEIDISNIYIDIGEFEQKIKQLDVIKFSSTDNLFTQNVPLNKAFKNYLGIDTDINFKIEISCQTDSKNLIDKILFRIRQATNQMEINDLILVGKSNEEFEEIFNQGTFTKKFEIYLNENDEGLLKPEDVQTQLINRINNV